MRINNHIEQGRIRGMISNARGDSLVCLPCNKEVTVDHLKSEKHRKHEGYPLGLMPADWDDYLSDWEGPEVEVEDTGRWKRDYMKTWPKLQRPPLMKPTMRDDVDNEGGGGTDAADEGEEQKEDVGDD